MQHFSAQQPESIDGNPAGKDLLSMWQLTATDIFDYLDEARAAENALRGPEMGVDLLPRVVLKAVMRQPSTRTGGSMTTAMAKLGGYGELISGMHSSSEAKGETIEDSWVAFATQSDILGIRTKEEDGPGLAARVIDQEIERGHLWRKVPVINLGDGRNEHPTQALGDIYTMFKSFGDLEGKKLTLVGDLERYRAHHSLLIGAYLVGMSVTTVETPLAPTPQNLVDIFGNRLQCVERLEDAITETDVLYIGRNPDEYDGDDLQEQDRSRELAEAYNNWVLTPERLQTMKQSAVVLHPRPRRDEIPTTVDDDPRMQDVPQMQNMIAMRMAIIARHMGESIIAGRNS